MCEVPVFYTTTEGQTRRIAERFAKRVREHGFEAQAIQIDSRECREVDWNRVRGVCLGASIHVQKHQPAAVAFARSHVSELTSRPSVFFSVSLAAASKNPDEVMAARKLAETFLTATG